MSTTSAAPTGGTSGAGIISIGGQKADEAVVTATMQSRGNPLFALQLVHAWAGGGYLTRSGEQLLVRGEGRIQSLDEIGEVLVETRADGVPVRVRDVGRVHLAPLIRQGAVTRDGRGEVVTGLLYVDPGADDLHGHLKTVARPLNTLEAAELNPGAAALAKVRFTVSPKTWVSDLVTPSVRRQARSSSAPGTLPERTGWGR